MAPLHDPEAWFPRCYDLSNTSDLEDFQLDFNRG